MGAARPRRRRAGWTPDDQGPPATGPVRDVDDDPATDAGRSGRRGGPPTSLTARHVRARRDRQGVRRPRHRSRPAQRRRRPRPRCRASPASPAPPSCSIGRDMRPSGPELVDAFTDGVPSQGVDVVDIGLASSDLVYFAAGHLDRPGAIFTASHNPAEYNGVKFCLAGARPVGVDGLGEIKAVASTVLDGHGPADAARAGSRREQDLLPAFADHVVSFVDSTRCARCASSPTPPTGWAASSCRPCSSASRRSTLEVMYGELDGTFPNHPADPLQPANQRDLQARVRVRRLRRRAGVRRRRRPGVRRRRARRRAVAARRRRRSSPPPCCARTRAPRSCTT